MSKMQSKLPHYLWRHRKTGAIYVIIGYTVIEDSWTPAVRYQKAGSRPGGDVVRPCAEFFDGRFEAIVYADVDMDENGEEEEVY